VWLGLRLLCLITVALDRAYENRKPSSGLIHHSDRGSQYTAKSYQLKLVDYGMVGSMSRAGTPTDNPQAESFMKTLKYEEIYQFGYETIADVQSL
jgi:putative transposase